MKTGKPKRETVHICNLGCWFKCKVGHHFRLEPEAKCRCCRRFSKNTAHELSRSRDWRDLTVKWWEPEAGEGGKSV